MGPNSTQYAKNHMELLSFKWDVEWRQGFELKTTYFDTIVNYHLS